MTFNKEAVSLTPGPMEKRVSRLVPESVPEFNTYRTQSKRTYKQFANELDNAANRGADTTHRSNSAINDGDKMVGQIANIAIEKIKLEQRIH